jgi:hypothetical protein
MRSVRLAFALLPGFLSPLLAACGGATNPAQPVVYQGEGGPTGDGSDDGPVVMEMQCQAGQFDCSGSCVNTQTDSHHCGTCGNACNSGSRCSNGTCVVQATPEAGTGLPPDPGGPAPTSTATSVLAISQLFYGDTDRSGNPSTTAWEAYGLDLDGKITTASSTDVCSLQPGSSRQVQVDGNDGIDNSFGSQIMPILETLDSTFSQEGNAALQAGDATPLFSLLGLGNGDDYSPLPGTFSRAAPSTTAPLWNGSDVRNVDSNTLPVSFSAGYMNQRVWVGEPASGPLAFDMHFTNFGANTLPLQAVQLEMQVAQGAGTATLGNLGAVIVTSDMVNWLQQIAGDISASLCSGSAFQSIAMQIEQGSDILYSSSNGVANQPGAQCDAISIGIGFNATAVQVGSGVPVNAPMNPCQ